MLLKKCRLVDPSQGIDDVSDILIEGHRVKKIGKNLKAAQGQTVDLSGTIVMPGFIDMHVHLREPGREDKETVETGTRAAAAGGFTAVACMPNTTPPNDNQSVTDLILKKNREAGYIHVYPVGCISREQKGESLADMAELKEAGAVAVSDDGRGVQNSELMRRAMEYAHEFGLLVIDHCEDLTVAAGGVMHEGYISTLLGFPAISSAAEDIMVARDIILSDLTGIPVHIAHVSTKGAVRFIKHAKDRGVPVTAEVTPHHLILQDTSVRSFNTNYKMNPPLRTLEDSQELIHGLVDGTIDVIATDHAPHTLHEKELEFTTAPFGIIGLETAIPLIVDRFVHSGILSWSRLAENFSVNPAKILNIEGGTLAAGSIANITVINPDMVKTVDVQKFHSKARNSPFHGWELKGWPVYTIVEGKIVFDGPQNTVISRND